MFYLHSYNNKATNQSPFTHELCILFVCEWVLGRFINIRPQIIFIHSYKHDKCQKIKDLTNRLLSQRKLKTKSQRRENSVREK